MWFDFNINGNWADADEHIIIDEPVAGGSTVLKVDVPEGVSQGKLFSRFRFSTVPGLTFVGIAIDGEVEDYWLDLIFNKVETADQNNSLPTEFRLYQNYLNPFNSSTEISFDLPKAAKVQLSIYNLMGVERQVLSNEFKTAGFHRIIWNGKDKENNQLPSGIYLYRLKAGEFSAVKKLISLK